MPSAHMFGVSGNDTSTGGDGNHQVSGQAGNDRVIWTGPRELGHDNPGAISPDGDGTDNKALALLARAGCIAFVRWARRTRATREEERVPLPGDELVAAPMWEASRATTIRAPRREVWPWLVQMGYPTHRAGWYTPYWMDRVLFGIRARSADRIVPGLQTLAIGDRVPDSPDAVTAYFTVAGLVTERELVLISHTHPLPLYRDVDFSWAFVLRDAGADTRLIMRARVAYTPVGPRRIIRLLVAAGFGGGDVVQAGAMLGGIKQRAESRAR